MGNTVLVDAGREAGQMAAARILEALHLPIAVEGCRLELLARDELHKLWRGEGEAAFVATRVVGEVEGLSLLAIPATEAARTVCEAVNAPPGREIALGSFTAQMVLRQMASVLSTSHAERLAAMDEAAPCSRALVPEIAVASWDSAQPIVSRLAPRGERLAVLRTTLRAAGLLGGEHFFLVSGERLAPLHAQDAPSGEPVPCQGKRILVADHDRGFCALVGSWLADTHELVFAHDGEEALRRGKEERPDVVLIAPTLPLLSGYSLAWVLKNDARYVGVPVIFVVTPDTDPAASPPDPDASLWVRSLADGHLVKPVIRKALVDMLRQHLQGGAAPSGLPSGNRLDPGDERRLTPRLSLRLDATLTATCGDADGTILELSPRGALVRCSLPLGVGSFAQLAFQSPHGPFEGTCEVLYVRDTADGPALGVQFQSLSSECQRILIQTMSEEGRRGPATGPPPS